MTDEPEKLMRFVCSALPLLSVILVLAASARAQEEPAPSVEGRLLEILKARGIITDTEFDELSKLETQLRRESDLDAQLESRIEEMVNRIPDDAPKSGYKVGKGFGWTTADGKFSLSIGGWIQTRLTHTEYDSNTTASRFEDGQPNFKTPRTRLNFEGFAFENWWKYRVQFEVQGDTARGPVSTSGGMPAVTSTGNFTSQNRLTELKDAYIDFAKWNPFNIRAGQFKVPYSRQQLTAVWKQEFVDRSIVDRNFAIGRDHGIMFHGVLGGEKNDLFEYSAGAFDGEGENFINNDDGLLYAARVAINPLGGIPYSECDFASSEDFKIAVGLNAYFHDNDNHNQAGARFDTWSVGGDLTMVWAGFFFTGELHYREDEQATSDREAIGWFAQLGYFIVPREFEIALRASDIDVDNAVTGATAQREYLGALSYYFHEHNLKIQADFGRVELHDVNANNDEDAWRFRLQAQIVF